MAKDLIKPERKKKEPDQYIGQVVNTEDSEKFLRVQIRVQGKHPDPEIPDKDLPWCEYALPPGNRHNEGTLIPVEPGDYVWVDFPYDGDVRRPRLLGSVHYCPEGVPNFPHEAWCGPDAVEHKRMPHEPMPEDREYFKQVVFSQKGIVVEIVQDSVIVTQKETGSAIEINPDGDIILHGEKDVYLSAQRDIFIHALGSILITAGGAFSATAGTTASVIGAQGCLLQGGPTSISLNENGECHGDFHFDGNIDADGTILDVAGNTPHHSH